MQSGQRIWLQPRMVEFNYHRILIILRVGQNEKTKYVKQKQVLATYSSLKSDDLFRVNRSLCVILDIPFHDTILGNVGIGSCLLDQLICMPLSVNPCWFVPPF